MNIIHRNKLKVLFTVMLTLLLMFQYNLERISIYFDYTDEIIALLILIYMLFSNKSRVRRDSIVIIVCLFMLCFIGVLSNIVSDIEVKSFYIFIDMLSVIKVFLTFIVSMSFFNDDDWKYYIKIIYPIVFIYIIIASIFCVLAYAEVVNMADDSRFGLLSYRFISKNAGTFGYTLMACVGIIISKDTKSTRFSLPICLALVVLTTKGPQIIFVTIFILISYFLKYKNKIRWYHIVLLSLVALVLGQFQISNYLLNDTSARFYLIKYGFITANNYLPFGSGFATYGSEMSRRFYSPLYYEYGFYNIWGLNENYSWFINDNYWPMIVGQLGWIGLLLMMIVFYKLYVIINKTIIKRNEKAFALALLMGFLVGSVGSGYLTSSIGVLGFGILGFIVRNKITVGNKDMQQ